MVKKRRSQIRHNPRFEFIPTDKWKKLTDEERSTLGSYKRTWGWLKKREKELEELETLLTKKIKSKKLQINKYKNKLNQLNDSIDHLRSTYNFTISFYNYNTYKRKDGVVNKFYMISCGFSDHNKTKVNFPCGNEDRIKNHLIEYYRQTQKKSYFEMYEERINQDWIEFIKKECSRDNGVIKSKLWDLCLEDPSTFKKKGFKFKVNIEYFFPLPQKSKK